MRHMKDKGQARPRNSDCILEANRAIWVLSERQKQFHCGVQTEADLKGSGVSSWDPTTVQQERRGP